MDGEQGLYPRVRGADTGTHAPTGWGRSSTPACAGLTLSPDHPVVNDRLYPRVRGADNSQNWQAAFPKPLPPRARG